MYKRQNKTVGKFDYRLDYRDDSLIILYFVVLGISVQNNQINWIIISYNYKAIRTDKSTLIIEKIYKLIVSIDVKKNASMFELQNNSTIIQK